jgi:hypothetical protein
MMLMCVHASLQAAFEHCMRAYVIRCECDLLGPGHPDTAAAGHNLGMVLRSGLRHSFSHYPLF